MYRRLVSQTLRCLCLRRRRKPYKVGKGRYQGVVVGRQDWTGWDAFLKTTLKEIRRVKGSSGNEGGRGDDKLLPG